MAALGAILFLATAMVTGQAGASAQAPRPSQQESPAERVVIPHADQASKLLDQLTASKDAQTAAALARRIERLWMRSGSDTADLLMSRAAQAITRKEPALAIELVDRIIALRPQWAEAWNKRATAFFLLGDSDRAVADLAETLRREPRHFQALAGLGAIFRQAGDEKRALAAFRGALAIHPHYEDIRKLADRLAPDVDGRDL